MGAQRVDRQLWVALCGGALHVRASTAEAALDDEEVEDDEDAAVLTVNQCSCADDDVIQSTLINKK